MQASTWHETPPDLKAVPCLTKFFFFIIEVETSDWASLWDIFKGKLNHTERSL